MYIIRSSTHVYPSMTTHFHSASTAYLHTFNHVQHTTHGTHGTDLTLRRVYGLSPICFVTHFHSLVRYDTVCGVSMIFTMMTRLLHRAGSLIGSHRRLVITAPYCSLTHFRQNNAHFTTSPSFGPRHSTIVCITVPYLAQSFYHTHLPHNDSRQPPYFLVPTTVDS